MEPLERKESGVSRLASLTDKGSWGEGEFGRWDEVKMGRKEIGGFIALQFPFHPGRDFQQAFKNIGPKCWESHRDETYIWGHSLYD